MSGLKLNMKYQGQRKKRIFWLGMHVVLTKTELPRLKFLGYEVFNPPYLADTIDQSANLDWSTPSTTLPVDILNKLSSINFYYAEISEDIAEILNEYFDVVIVTINPGWLNTMLSAFMGPIIFRTFGQPYSLSSELINIGAIYKILERENFWFSPHSSLTAEIEDDWLIERMKIVPYSLAPDIFSYQDSWEYVEKNTTIGLLCPRAADIPYYNANYQHLGHYFPGTNYKIFGAQQVMLDDPRIVGTLERSEYLRKFSELRGYTYHYEEPHVCYLPPIEFMVIGGPVTYLQGSLLSKYFETAEAPGKARDIDSLVTITKKMEAGDLVFINEVIDSQRDVRKLYCPEYVYPIFDKELNTMIEGDPPPKPVRFAESIVSKIPWESPDGSTVLLFHHFGPLIHKQGREFHCSEGIARVTRLMVNALISNEQDVLITSFKRDIDRIRGFFGGDNASKKYVKVISIDESIGVEGHIEAVLTQIIPTKIRKLNFYKKIILRFIKKAFRVYAKNTSNSYIESINNNPGIANILIPHYYLFPEALKIKGKDLYLYLPDYLPHFYKGNRAMGDDKSWEAIGKRIASRAKGIFTNSKFTAKYLPNTALKIKEKKIFFAHLPFLNNLENEVDDAIEFRKKLPETYIFYPTRNRPSKRLNDFLAVLELVNHKLIALEVEKRVYGILTTELSEDLMEKYPLGTSYLRVMSEVSDNQLRILYKKASCLLFTSEMEGNFPTQISEALKYKTPIIASKMDLITAELGQCANNLQLISIGDIEKFSEAVINLQFNRDNILKSQELVKEWVDSKFTIEKFNEEFIKMIKK
jgi:glycosyltransferase involved in cell wall biosynthesis